MCNVLQKIIKKIYIYHINETILTKNLSSHQHKEELVLKKKKRSKNTKYRLYKNPIIKTCKSELDVLLTVSRVNKNYLPIYNNKKRFYNKLLAEEQAKMFENKILDSDNKCKCMWSIHNEILVKQKTFLIIIIIKKKKKTGKYNTFVSA